MRHFFVKLFAIPCVLTLASVGAIACDAALADVKKESPSKDSIAAIDLDKRPSTIETNEVPPNPLVVMKTAKGSFVIELYEDLAPNTVANFMHLVEIGHYKDSSFHRVEGAGEAKPQLRIVQGGRKNNSEAFDWGIFNEAFIPSYGELKNETGTISMARTADFHSAGCQFFINLIDMPGWDSKNSPYCVFGKVVRNLDVVKALRGDAKPGDNTGDKILDAWVVRKRNHEYNPWVIRPNARSMERAVKPKK